MTELHEQRFYVLFDSYSDQTFPSIITWEWRPTSNVKDPLQAEARNKG